MELSTGRSALSFPSNARVDDGGDQGNKSNAPPDTIINLPLATNSAMLSNPPNVLETPALIVPAEQMPLQLLNNDDDDGFGAVNNDDSLMPQLFNPVLEVNESVVDDHGEILVERGVVGDFNGDIDEGVDEGDPSVGLNEIMSGMHNEEVFSIVRRSCAGLRNAVEVVLSSLNLEAISLSVGTTSATVAQYKSFRRMINCIISKYGTCTKRMPSYDVVLRKLYPVLFSFAFARHDVVQVDVNVRAWGVLTRRRRISEEGGVAQAPLLIVKASTWLLRDSEEILRWIEQPHVHMTYAMICSYDNAGTARHPTLVNNHNILSEMAFRNGTWQTGRIITKGDTITVACSIKQHELLCELEKHPSAAVHGSRVTLTVVVGRGELLNDGELGDGAADVVINLLFNSSRTNNRPVLEAKLHFHLGYFTRPSMSLTVSANGVQTDGIRCRNLSLMQRSPALSPRAPTQGQLQDGRNYLRVPLLLFADDFSATGGRGGSSGGCYILPLLVPVWARRGMHSVRAIGLSPPGVSSNVTMKHIVEDIVACGTTGVEIELLEGRRVVIFGEVVGFVGDYPGEAHALDVMGPTASAPCTLCIFQRSSPVLDETSTRYAYTTSVHSADPSFRRTKDKMRVIRQKAANADDLKDVGLKALSESELARLPLHHLSDELERHRCKVPLTREGQPVVNFDFDPYQNSFVGPSHLFYGLSQNILEAMLRFCTPEQRRQVDSLLFKVLCGSGVVDAGSFIHRERPKLHTMTISTTIAVLLVAPWAFSSVLGLSFNAIDETEQGEHEDLRKRILNALYLFKKLVYATLYLPSSETDGLAELEQLDKNNGEDRLLVLRALSVKYVQAIDRLCRNSVELCSVLDKPNVHRLLELYMHTLPRLGHVKTADELQFESFHQPLKRGLAKSNHQDGHIKAMREVIANEWRARIGDVARELPSLQNLTEENCERLMKAAFGDSKLLRDDEVSYEEVRLAFSSAVLEEFKRSGPKQSLFASRTSVWAPLKSSQIQRPGGRCQAERDSADKASRLFLLQLVGVQRGTIATVNMVHQFQTAVRYTVTNADLSRPLESQIGRGRYKAYNAVSIGEALQILCTISHNALLQMLNRDGVHMLPLPCERGKPSFWLVAALYQVKDCPFVYARLLYLESCTDTEEGELIGGGSLYVVRKSNATVLVQLTSGCIKGLLLHSCQERDCLNSGESGIVSTLSLTKADTTSPSMFQHRWTIFGSREGFPPRSA